MSSVRVQLVGGPTAVLEMGGLRLLTDPTFDPPGDYPRPGGIVLTRYEAPALREDGLGRIDAVLLSHDEHQDNLDRAGRALLASAPLVLTTQSGASRLGGPARGLAPWAETALALPGGGALRVVAVPALHGPEEHASELADVIGFVLSGAGLPSVYVSGDNASLARVRAVAERLGPVDVAVLFAGAARPGTFGGAYVTITSRQAAEAAAILKAGAVVPVHFQGWAHFTEGADTLRAAFTEAGLESRLHLLDPGQSVTVP